MFPARRGNRVATEKDRVLTTRPLNFRAFRSVWGGVCGALCGLFLACAPALADDAPAAASATAATIAAADAAAPAIPGADAPAFEQALALWLADDEEPALRALAALAAEGNAAAQILLGIVDKSPPLQGPWLASLPRNERIAVMRAPGGLSGQSWLASAADQPLAENWLTLLSVDAGLGVVRRFAQLGEPRAAREAAVVLAAREHPDLRTALPGDLDPELTYLLWRSAADARREMLLAQVPPAHPQRLMMGEEREGDALVNWLAEAPAARAVAALCDVRCADSRATCMTGAYHALASHNAVLLLGTPAEALVSQEDFLQSPRGQATVLRRMLQATDARGRGAMISRMRAHDECLAGVLSDERARYHYRRPGVGNGAADQQD